MPSEHAPDRTTTRSRGVYAQLSALSSAQRHTFVACLLGWALDAFDFFILVFAVRAIAEDFHSDVKAVTVAISLTLAMRPVGALLFGWAADRFGRHPALMVNIVSYSVLELCSAAAPSLPVLIAVRGLYGVAMGGEWGVGAALALESVPADSRGAVSGLLQQGYVLGYLLAALLFGVAFGVLGWRGMFVVGAMPALLVVYIRAKVPESKAWERQRAMPGDSARFAPGPRSALSLPGRAHGGLQLLHPRHPGPLSHVPPEAARARRPRSATCRRLEPGRVRGRALVRRALRALGRRRAIVRRRAARAAHDPPLGAGAEPRAARRAAPSSCSSWCKEPGESVPGAPERAVAAERVRGTFPGFAYQLGNLIAAGTATLQAMIAEAHGGNYALGLGAMTAVVALALALIAFFGPEAKGIDLDD